MLMSIDKRKQMFVIGMILLGLMFYGILAFKILGNHIKYAVIFLFTIIGLLITLTLPLSKIFLLFVVSLPMMATLVIDIGFTIMPSYMLLILLIVIMLVSRDFWYTRSPLDYSIFAFLGVCTLSLIQNVLAPPPVIDFFGTMKYRGVWFRSILQLFLLYFSSLTFFLTTHLCSNKKSVDSALKTYFITAIIISFYGVYQGFASHFGLPLSNITNALRSSGWGHEGIYRGIEIDFSQYRSQATFGEPLGFGHYILSILPIPLAAGAITKGYFDLEGRKWMSGKTLALVILLFLFAMFMTRSRGAMVSLIAPLIGLLILLGMKNIPRLLGYMFMSVAIIAGFYFISIKYLGVSSDILRVLRFRPPEALSDYSSIEFMMNPNSQRYEFYFQLVPTLISRYPFLGVGIGNFSLHAASLFDTRILIAPTSLWGSVLLETGIFGFIVFCWMVFTFYKVMIQTLWKVRNTHWAPYIVGLILCFTGPMVQYLTFGYRMCMYLWFLMGISMSLVNIIRQEQKQATLNGRLSLEG